MPLPIDPLAVHMERSPDCPFVANNDKENLPFVVESETPELEEIRNEFRRAKTPPKTQRSIETDSPTARPLGSQGIDNNLLGGHAGFARAEDFIRPENPPLQRAVQVPVGTFNGNALQHLPAVPDIMRQSPRSPPDFMDDDRFETMNYRNEKSRLDSFKYWPNRAAVRPHELARCGFYYLGTEDRVQCAFCKGVLRNWDATDIVYDEHKRHFPMCPFIREPNNCGNEAMRHESELNGVSMRRPPTGREVCA